MKYFGPSYRHLTDTADIFREAHSRGLEFRLGELFFDPETSSYDADLGNRLSQAKAKLKNEIDFEHVSRITYLVQSLSAVAVYALRNPEDIWIRFK